MDMEIITNNEEETGELAREFAGVLGGGEIIALTGELGAGKTAFTKGLALGIGVDNTVTSPTFVIMKVYPAKKLNIRHFVHIDAYRLNSGEDLTAIGAVEYFNRKDSIVIIEWPEKIKDILPQKYLSITIEHLDENKRKILLPR
jgi:tRNA threonylcarbamoyladenosine biosynthesis protein TsaE